ncbi:MAG: RagB/SusD family nutrient uptake outer membrane protein, partial [Bacteroidales bacterium]|nr:RagB/SusD family nutrient uptake outer membrane protein [Bacteroidales bacterium]
LDKYPVADRETFAQMVLGNKETNNMILRYKNTMSQSQYVSDRIYTTLKNRPVSIDFINVFDNRSKDVRFTESLNSRRNPIKLFIGSIRSEEMLLIAAESSYYLSDNDRALLYVNTLRNNRIEGHIPLTPTTIPNIEDSSVVVKDAMGNNLTPLSRLIINERRKEMFMEGDRIMQLKRLGSPQFWVSRNGLAYTTYSFMYTYPIPADDIELNKGIIQNEGYTEFVYN